MAKWVDSLAGQIERAPKSENPSIVYDLGPGGGSGRGIGWYARFMECGKATYLDRAFPRAETIAGKSGSGTIFHAFQDIYHDPTRKLSFRPGLADIRFEGRAIDPTALAVGWHQFDWYRDRYAPDFFGHVLHSEQRFPKTDEQARALAELVFKTSPGCPPSSLESPAFTLQYDLTTIASEETVARWATEWGIIAEPGLYVVDWKTTDSARRTIQDEYTYKLQAYAYSMAWDVLFPNMPLKGFWYIIVTRTQDVKLFPVLLKPAGHHQREAVWCFFEGVWEKLNSDKPDRANPHACFSWFRMCRHLATGRCHQH